MNHTQKQTLARRMRSREDIKNKIPIFETAAWDAHKQAIVRRIAKREGVKITV